MHAKYKKITARYSTTNLEISDGRERVQNVGITDGHQKVPLSL